MKRLKAIVSYDGTNFSGYQVQVNARTVQGELENALKKIHKVPTFKVISSGRTDAKVHGINQPIHFDTTLSIPEDRWPRALNSLLPNDIVVKEVKEVEPHFHARFDTVGKEYRYIVNSADMQDVFKRNYTHHLPAQLSLEKMKEAAGHLIGTHDFTSFSSPKTEVIDKVRTIFAIDIKQSDDEWTFTFVGSGFLYQMVRILVGTLLDIGQGDREPEEVPRILEGKNRELASPTAPGSGLYLAHVFYDNEALEKEIQKLGKEK
ncbi:tRNA pseudouridine(38-40) synthase TruA [Bacillus shivajii]|uniref:tRNA pseudouridine(38-40) synthase TruA n=1 Tax=Bacillus shivajii TaxID=1983719 RepID=UPI001CFAB411|nr:tRNA pseudouridine(38-40) synthase TruA [Bacillus shivajii]UCZ53400.1 tRNA pseudouridine(38-40) synthase TruA [Bacillus shivajii]